MTDTSRTIRIYNLSSQTGEFIGAGDAFIPEHTGLPAHCTDLAPPEAPEGFVAVFDASLEKWSITEDNRGKTAFDKNTGQPILIAHLGTLPENCVLISPNGKFQKWDGTGWVVDEVAMRSGYLSQAEMARQELLSEADKVTGDWRIELMLGSISDDDKELLIKWMAYIKELKALDFSSVTDGASYEAILWPVLPS